MTSTPQYHYYAATGTDWAVAPSRQEAIAKVARQASPQHIRAGTRTNGCGMYVWTCRVLTPIGQEYSIDTYAPRHLMWDGKDTEVRVPTDQPQHYWIVNTKGHVVVAD